MGGSIGSCSCTLRLNDCLGRSYKAPETAEEKASKAAKKAERSQKKRTKEKEPDVKSEELSDEEEQLLDLQMKPLSVHGGWAGAFSI